MRARCPASAGSPRSCWPSPAWPSPGSIVRWVPEAAGSGVQRLEAEMRGEEGPARLVILPAKFVGGLLSLGSGMALGREGPTVQMGASLAGAVGRAGRLGAEDVRDLSAAAGGAGLAVAFNAPLGGILFVLEEVSQAFRVRLVLATLVAVGVAVAVAQLLIGTGPDFTVAALLPMPVWALGPVVLLGGVCGFLGVLYNRSILGMLDLAARLPRIPPEVKAGLVGAVVAVVGLASPPLVGGGDSVTQPVLEGSVPLLGPARRPGRAVGAGSVVLLGRHARGALRPDARDRGGAGCVGRRAAGTPFWRRHRCRRRHSRWWACRRSSPRWSGPRSPASC